MDLLHISQISMHFLSVFSLYLFCLIPVCLFYAFFIWLLWFIRCLYSNKKTKKGCRFWFVGKYGGCGRGNHNQNIVCKKHLFSIFKNACGLLGKLFKTAAASGTSMPLRGAWVTTMEMQWWKMSLQCAISPEQLKTVSWKDFCGPSDAWGQADSVICVAGADHVNVSGLSCLSKPCAAVLGTTRKSLNHAATNYYEQRNLFCSVVNDWKLETENEWYWKLLWQLLPQPYLNFPKRKKKRISPDRKLWKKVF